MGSVIVRSMSMDIVRPGMIVGSPVEDRLGRHLVESGTVLTAYIIEQLRYLGVGSLQIRIGEANDKRYTPTMSKLARQQVERLRREDPAKLHFSRTLKKQIAAGVQTIYNNPSPKELADTTRSIMDDLMTAIDSNNAVALNIRELKTSDEYTFEHSVDVATISMIIAKQQKKSRKEVYEIGMAGLLHDIGKTKVPPEILNKPARLTPEEFEIMKKHSTYSYEMVQDNSEIPDSVKVAMLQHHEKIDGSGYPNGAMASGIHPYAKILTVADIYDALVTDRPYKQGMPPGQAVEMLMAMTDKLDMNDLKSFLSSMILYPVDSYVELSNGETARVVQKNPEGLLRPVVVGCETGKVYDLSQIDCANIIITNVK
ncbi:MAG: HD-GYP domain-containing protein [Lachnospiraceae bacterium]|nr:HD-GYP domain-containing protein [Lachnospiraceae bacterium]